MRSPGTHGVTGIGVAQHVPAITTNDPSKCNVDDPLFFPLGSAVEYFGSCQSRWIPAKVRGWHPSTGLYDLDCKAQVPAARLRWPPVSEPDGKAIYSRPPGPISVGKENTSPQSGPAKLSEDASFRLGGRQLTVDNGLDNDIHAEFPLGAAVEYNSVSQGRWINAKVLCFHPKSGLY